MSDDFGDDVPETRDTPEVGGGSAPTSAEHDEEPRETRESPSVELAAKAEQLAVGGPWETDPYFQHLPEGWKRQVRSRAVPVAEAVAKHIHNKEQAALRVQRQTQDKIEHAATARAQQDVRTQQRLDQLHRLLTGEPDPEAEPVDPLAAQLAGLGQKVDQLGLLAQHQAAEAQISQQIDGLESYAASDVSQVIEQVPDYEQREEFLQQRMLDGELLAVQQAYPHLTDDQAMQVAHQRVQAQVANMIVNYAAQGRSLAVEVVNLTQSLGYGQQQMQYQTPAPPQRVSGPTRQIEVQRQRAASAASLAGGARPSTFKGSPKQIENAVLNMSDDDFADFIGEGPDAKARLQQLLAPYATG